MENKFDKIEPGTGHKICPGQFDDGNKIGLAYFILHHAPSDITSDQVGKYSHHGLAIDINRLSNDEIFCTAHFNLHVRDETDYSTYVESNYRERKWTDDAFLQPIGRIPSSEIQQYGLPHHYAGYLEWTLSSEVHRPMTMIKNSARWSRDLNCQNFNKAAITYLGLNYPTDVTVFNDCFPNFFDIYGSASLASAYPAEKTT